MEEKKLENKLFEECKSRSYNCSLTYQSINDYSVEIYKNYGKDYKQIFYTDGHIEKADAIKEALDTLLNY